MLPTLSRRYPKVSGIFLARGGMSLPEPMHGSNNPGKRVIFR